MKAKEITINNAREHNLKNINVSIPRKSLTVITGISGSGKSSLAFDTIYAEGNRRYVESLSVYARQFIDMLKKPEVENIEGLSPAIAINQRTISHNARSTVGTMTDIYDYLRLLFAKLGEPHCYKCGEPIQAMRPEQIVEEYSNIPDDKKITILSPIVRGKKGEYTDLILKLKTEGFSKVIIDGKTHDLDEEIRLDKNKLHSIDLIVDKLISGQKSTARLGESISLAMKLSGGLVSLAIENRKIVTISNKFSCIDCGISYSDVEPRTFSFNSPYGACKKCEGLGKIEKEEVESVCDECNGTRLKKESLAIKVNGKSIYDLASMSMERLREHLLILNFEGNKKIIADKIVKEIIERLNFVIDVGLGYLDLNRVGYSLSGGEAQRIRLATQLGCGLTGVLYILDEPSIGLHPRDNRKLIEALLKLRDKGNTVIIVEHDEDTIRSADYIIDLGPGAGIHGGYVVAQGNLNSIISNKESITGNYLSSNIKIHIPKRKQKTNKLLTISDVNTHNLKNVTVSFPIGLITCITGVSGSGKSSLITDTLVPEIHRLFNDPSIKKSKIKGLEHIDKIVDIDQSPIGQTPRSNPATYIDLFSPIRDLFAKLPDSRTRGYKLSRFSFNVTGGRCEACEGQGMIKIEMKFMPDVFVKCDVCSGKKFNRETLEIKYKGKSIYEVLDMTVEEALEFFKNIRMLYTKLKVLSDVGLGYLKLGQSATTLSGGESQRIKLSKELSKRSDGKTLYILDEPTTGLHFDDIKKLIHVIHQLRDQGNTIIVVEHNLEVIKCSDYIIDIGPDGGEQGGKIIANGTPEEVSEDLNSKTGVFLKEKLRRL
ncbi:MAG: excinuclease ABC subunit UvrA [bacterium]